MARRSTSASAKKLCITFTVDPHLIRRVDQQAKVLGVSRSEWLTNAIRDALEGNDMMTKVMSNDATRDAFYSAFSKPGVLSSLAAALAEELKPGQERALLTEFDRLAKVASKKPS